MTSSVRSTRAIILAAGRSTRFKTKKSKLLFNICGQSMIMYPLRVFQSLAIPSTVIVGYQADAVQHEVGKSGIADVNFVLQEQQLGTGHALACSQSTWDADEILIMNGDMPLVTSELIEALLKQHRDSQSTVSFFATDAFDPRGYGRIVEEEGSVRVVEQKDCTEEQRKISLVNAGVYVMQRSFIEQYVETLSQSSVTGEVYLPDLIAIAGKQGLGVTMMMVPFDNVRGVNTLQELWEVEQIKRSEFIKKWMAHGVRFELAQSIHIDMNVEIGAGSFIGTGVHLLGNTKIGEECFVGAFSIIEDTTIEDSTTIHSHSVIQHSTIGSQVHVGPFARLRDHVIVGDHVEIGNFVEMKNSHIGDNSKTKHLSYIGDARIGSKVNVGAGTITCNFDGVKKNVTVIEDNAFIGSNNTLIAPLNIGTGAYTAAGSTLTQDVPSDALAIARDRQVNKLGYASKLRAEMKQDANQGHAEKLTHIFESKEDAEFQFRGAVKTEGGYKEGF